MKWQKGLRKMDTEDKNYDSSKDGERLIRGKKAIQPKTGGMRLTVITPNEEFYDGMVESVIIRTPDGYMGFLEKRAPVCVLLHDEGQLQFREAGAGVKGQEGMVRAMLSGGFAFMDEEMTIYTDCARWLAETEAEREKPEDVEFRMAMEPEKQV